jgi:hypothetical protein
LILLDFSAIMFASIHVDIKGGTKPNFEYIRHLAVNTIRHYNMQHRTKYGEMHLIFDSKSWRKSAFPLYKWVRSHDREINPDQDWEDLYGMIEDIKAALVEHFPYPTIEINFAEADDIIGVMSRNPLEPVLIISNDKDFAELTKHRKVELFRPSIKDFWTVEDTQRFLYELIMKGDKSDGVPNIYSADDFLKTQALIKLAGVEKTPRAKPVSQKFMDTLWDAYKSNDEDIIKQEFGELYKNFRRNRRLISLDYIPDILVDSIKEGLNNITRQPIMKCMEYMTANGMDLLARCISDFEPNRKMKISLI